MLFEKYRLTRVPRFVLCAEATIVVSGRPVRFRFVKNRRARQYILRLTRDGSARVTMPWGGTLIEARAFADRHQGWLAGQLAAHEEKLSIRSDWSDGTEILLHGELIPLRIVQQPNHFEVNLGAHSFRFSSHPAELRPAIERCLWRLAKTELPLRVLELAAAYSVPVARITIRDQRSRWGSCSRKGTVSLNWRLVQAPDFVRDYIILHELAHVRHMNHSAQFWAEVARLCPGYAGAEKWLKAHSRLLR